MSLLDLFDTTAKLYYVLCLNKYTKPCWVCAVRDNIIIIIIIYCYCFFSASIHMGDSDIAEAE